MGSLSRMGAIQELVVISNGDRIKALRRDKEEN